MDTRPIGKCDWLHLHKAYDALAGSNWDTLFLCSPGRIHRDCRCPGKVDPGRIHLPQGVPAGSELAQLQMLQPNQPRLSLGSAHVYLHFSCHPQRARNHPQHTPSIDFRHTILHHN